LRIVLLTGSFAKEENAMTKRPVIVLIVTAVQTSIAAMFAGAAMLFSFLIFSLRNSATPSQGLKLALMMVLPLAVVAAVASWGMWKQRAWGWWTALVVNVLALFTMITDLVNGDPDFGDFAAATIFFACLTLFLPPRVREYFLRRRVA
jgi:uncharacterized membrane protein (DUF2068 family)